MEQIIQLEAFKKEISKFPQETKEDLFGNWRQELLEKDKEIIRNRIGRINL